MSLRSIARQVAKGSLTGPWSGVRFGGIMRSLRDGLESLAQRSDLFGAAWLRLRWAKAKALMFYSDYDYAQRLFRRKGETWRADRPVTFNDKLWYLKLSNRDPLPIECSDKNAVRAYVERCGLGHILKRSYGSFNSVEELALEDLPSPAYIKCSHGSGLNWVYRDGCSQRELLRKMRDFRYLLQQNPYCFSREWNYRDIVPTLVCEEYLETKSGAPIPELQFFCFHGEAKLVMYNVGLADENGAHQAATRWVFTPEFELMDIGTSMQTSEDTPAEPSGYKEMLRYAELLARPFPHVRVDLFNVDGSIYFNELTFYSGGGFVKLDPDEWQRTLGSWLDVSSFSIAPDARISGLSRVAQAFSKRKADGLEMEAV